VLKCIWQISDFIIFTQLLNVPGTVYLMSMGTKMGSKYPVWAPGSHRPVAIALSNHAAAHASVTSILH